MWRLQSRYSEQHTYSIDIPFPRGFRKKRGFLQDITWKSNQNMFSFSRLVDLDREEDLKLENELRLLNKTGRESSTRWESEKLWNTLRELRDSDSLCFPRLHLGSSSSQVSAKMIPFDRGLDRGIIIMYSSLLLVSDNVFWFFFSSSS